MRSVEPLRIDVFTYPVSDRPVPAPWGEFIDADLASPDDNVIDKENCGGMDAESLRAAIAEAAARSFETGREQGMRDGRAAETTEQQEVLRQAKNQGAEQAAHLANQFVEVRDRFLETMEHEVVKLALAIAERILRREAQTDPLFLVGAARVALRQLSSTLRVKLRVASSNATLWNETMARLPNLNVRPIVVPDESMHDGDCIIETEMGSVDLGVAAQVHRMEAALFDTPPVKEQETTSTFDTDRLAVQL